MKCGSSGRYAKYAKYATCPWHVTSGILDACKIELPHTCEQFWQQVTGMNTTDAVEGPQKLEMGKMDGSHTNNNCGDALREKFLEAGAYSMGSKRDRRSSSREEYLITLCRAAAAKAHVYPYE